MALETGQTLEGTLFMYPPLNIRTPGMGEELLSDPAFRRVNDLVGNILKNRGENPDLSLDPSRQLSQFTFALGVRAALGNMLNGLKLHAKAGVSVGEFAMYSAEGIIPIEPATEMLLDRDLVISSKNEDELQQVMIACTGIPPEETEEALIKSGVKELHGLELANIISPIQGVFSGIVRDVDQVLSLLSEILAEKGSVVIRKLEIATANHSKYMEKFQDTFQQLISGYFQPDLFRDPSPDELIYSTMWPGWVTNRYQPYAVGRDQLTRHVNLRDAFPEISGAVGKIRAVITADPLPKPIMPKIIRLNLNQLEGAERVPIINIFDTASLKKGITKLGEFYPEQFRLAGVR